MLSRREFLQRSSVVSLTPFLPCVLGKTASAAGAAADERVLVVIQLDGGNDGINTVVPFGDGAYGRVRKKLRLEEKRLHKLNDHVGLHQNLEAAKDLYDDGRLAIVQGVGYPNPNRSHFRSMKIWQTASFDEGQHDAYGWLGRALDQRSAPGSFADAMFVGQQETPVAVWGRRSSATAWTRADDLRLHGLVADLAPSPTRDGDSLQSFVSNQVLSAYTSAKEFQRRSSEANSDQQAKYPNTELAERLKLVSRLLQSGAQARVYYTVQTGYDTHSAQIFTHARLLNEFSGALKAFLDDLKAKKLEDRVVVLAFSEFGRRVAENDSAGTDHGTAGPVFLAGSRVQGGLHGATPDLTDLEAGDLKLHTDFRQVYATLLQDWLNLNPEPILGEAWGKDSGLSVL